MVMCCALFFVASCHSPSVRRLYEGAALGRDDVALIEVGESDMGIRKVDGERIVTHGGNPIRAVEVLPGDHVIEVRLYVPPTVALSGYWSDAELPLNAVAGTSYVVHCHRGASGAGFWIEDGSTGRIVTGAMPR